MTNLQLMSALAFFNLIVLWGFMAFKNRDGFWLYLIWLVGACVWAYYGIQVWIALGSVQ